MHGKRLVEAWEAARAQGQTRAEYARTLGISAEALKSRLKRARRSLHRQGQDTLPEVPQAERAAEFLETGNRAIASSSSDRITSPEELLEFLKIDLEVWEIERGIVNKWEGYRRDEKKSLTYVDGKASGSVEDTGLLFTAPLYQVKVWLVRRSPVALTPVISPVNLALAAEHRPDPPDRPRKRALVLSDPHFGFMRDFRTGRLEPFHDRRALDIALQIASTIQVDLAILAGDILDLAEYSDKFLRSPEMYWTTQPAIIEASYFVARLAAIAGETITMDGNHDDRLRQALLRHFMQAYDLRPADRLSEPPPMTVAALLGLDRLGVRHVAGYPSGRYHVNEMLAIIHGSVVRGRAGATASAVLERSPVSVGFGHIHRQELVARTVRSAAGNRTLYAFCPGCTCRIDGIVPGSTPEQDWQNGIAIIDYTDTGEHTVHLVSIDAGRAYFEGREYTGAEYVADLREHLAPFEEMAHQLPV